jgi:hypothetical protein
MALGLQEERVGGDRYGVVEGSTEAAGDSLMPPDGSEVGAMVGRPLSGLASWVGAQAARVPAAAITRRMRSRCMW